MVDVTDLLQQAASGQVYTPPSTSTIPATVETKKVEVAQASDAKKAAMGPAMSDYEIAAGAATGQKGWYGTEREQDLRSMNPAALIAKYGAPAGNDMIGKQVTAAGQVLNDQGRDDRTNFQWSMDNTKQIGGGLLSSLGGVANWGVGAVSDKAGTAGAVMLQDFNKYVQDSMSPTLQAKTRVQEGVNTLNERDNRVQEQVDIENGSTPLEAGISRVGRDAIDSISAATMDGATFQSGTAQAVGSLLAAGPLAKGIKALGSALVPSSIAAKAATGGTATERALAAIGEKAPILASIGSMEGGGAYQQVTADIMGRDHETLMKDSPMYRELIDQGKSQQEAKEAVANRTGLISAAITAPLAAATGTLVAKFEADPFARMGAKKLASLALKEPIEEGIQGATSQVAQNYAESLNADENKSMADGVGRQVGEGALYSAGATGVVQTPNIARGAVKAAGVVGSAAASGVAAAGSSLLSAAENKANNLRAANENTGPASRDAILEAAPQVMTQAQEFEQAIFDRFQQRAQEGQPAPQEEVEQAQSFAENFRKTLEFNTDDVRSSTLEQLGEVSSRPEAAFKLMDMFDTEKDPAKKADLALDMVSVLSNVNSFVNDNVQSIQDNYGSDPQVKSYVDALQELDGLMYQNPQRARALEEATKIFDDRGEEGNKIDVVDQRSADDAVAIATVSPGSANLETNQQVLFQAKQGKINITPQQQQALNVSIALLQAAKATSAEAIKLGNQTKAAEVTANITTEKGAKGESALQYAKDIVASYKRGELDIAGARLGTLANFAQGLQNKVAALNAHAAGEFKGKGVVYETTQNGGRDVPEGENPFFPASRPAFIVPTNPKSIQNAQDTHLDAKFLADVYNGLVDAFPDLNAQHITSVPLASEFLSPVNEVVESYRSSKAGNLTGQNATTPEVTATQEQTAQNETVPDAKLPVETPTETVAEPTESEPVKAESVQETVSQSDEVVAEPSKPKKGIAGVFENLHSFGTKGVNHFLSSYKLPSKQVSRLFAEEAPLSRMGEVLSNSAALTDFIGSAPQGNLTPEVADGYADLMKQAQKTVDIVSGRLKTFLDKPYSKSNPVTRRELLMGDKTVTTSRGTEFDPASLTNRAEGKALNITEVVDGDLVFNKELIESAALAAQQFALNLNDSVRDMEAKDAARLTGIPVDVIQGQPDLIKTLSSGLTLGALKDNLDSKIRSYWNVTNTADGYIGQQKGISGAVASLFVDAMIENGQLLVRKIHLNESNGLPEGEGRDINLFNLPENWHEADVQKYPTAIDDAVLVTPDQDLYVGADPKMQVAQTQMRNNLVENTPAQKEAIANEQKTPYFANFRMAGLYTAMGKDLVLKAFGAGDMRTKEWNVNHAKSLDGRNRGIAAGYEQMEAVLGRLQNVGEMQGTAWNETPIRYAFNMTRVGRLQMLGKQNPQSNKFIRSIISPTQATLDLSNQNTQGFKQFTLGMAQALDIKVHKLFFSKTQGKLMSLLDGPLKPAVDVLANFQTDLTPDSIGSLKGFEESTLDQLMQTFKAAGVPFSPHSLQAVMEYARYRDTPESRAEFKTDLYLEADGVTNGPINAMVLFTTGAFKASWVKNIAKGGLTFGRGLQTLADHIAGTGGRPADEIDLYSDAKDNTKKYVNELRDKITSSGAAKNVNQQMSHLLKAMDLFFGKDLTLTTDEDGNITGLELDRGITKNPLTITIYGSGAKGIASKLTSTMIEAIYEKMSVVAQNPKMSPAEAMFGGPGVTAEQAQAKFKLFNDSLSALTSLTSINSRTKGFMVFGEMAKRDFARDPKGLTFNGKQIENITSAMLTFFVTPMTQAIGETVGKELLQTADMVRDSVQIQSLIAEDAFIAEVQAKLAEKAKDPEWDKSNFLTNAELDEIYKKIAPVSPYIDTGAQRFYIAGSTNSDLATGDFGSSFDGKYPTPGTVDGPGPAGVSGVPYMNIGTGDGYMMQLISNMKNAIEGTLKIFDGMNMPLDKIEEGSRQANQAVWESWMANPLKAVFETNSAVLASMDLKSLSQATKDLISKSLFPNETETVSDAQLAQGLSRLNERLNQGQLSIEARHRAMARVQASVDQMAAAASPHVTEGAALEDTSDEAVANLLNKFYQEELAKLKGEKAPTVDLSTKMAELFETDESGVRTLNLTDIRSLVQELNLPADQQKVLEQVVSGTALRDFDVVYGTAEQVNDYIAESGLQGMNGREVDGEVQGFTSMADKTVYLLNSTPETLVHELIHAATFDLVSSYYGDREFAKANPQRAAAVKRIETLMEQFLKMNGTLSSNLNPRLIEAYNDAYAAIMEYRGSNDAQSKAAALNEFMAWNLSNRRLMALLKQTQANPLVRIANQVVQLIKSMFTGSRLLDDPKQDMFSNLLFNSSMLMYSQPTLASRGARVTLLQSTAYGEDARLNAVAETFQDAVMQYATTEPRSDQPLPSVVVSKAIRDASDIADLFIAKGFNMNAQQAFTFRNIVTALGTEALINPNSLAAAQDLYTHVIRTAKQEDFIDPTDTDVGRAEFMANQKYNVLLGNFGTTADSYKRSALLPAFIALATVDNGFREMLAQMDMPKTLKNLDGTMDAYLENLGETAMDTLGDRMAGYSSQPTSVKAAIDALNDQIQKTVQEQEGFLTTVTDRAGSLVDRGNDMLVDVMNKATSWGYEKGKEIRDNAGNRYTKLAGSVLAGVSGLVSQDNAAVVSEGILSANNNSTIWLPLRKFMQDVVGRVESNAAVYDMIKTTRAMVQQVRQQFREDLPAIIESKFTRKLTQAEGQTMTRVLARTDLASLRSAYSHEQIHDLLTKKSYLDRETAKLEKSIKDYDTGNWSLLQAKAKQLATYMNTGVMGSNLLSNATAISQLLGEKKRTPFQTRDAAQVRAIDHLVTLYSVEFLAKSDKDTIASLVQSEAEGLKFTLDYLVGQNQEEQRKGDSFMAKLNGYKGHIPKKMVDGVSMVVAENAESAKLRERSYLPAGDYVPSSIDPYTKAGDKTYFFARVSARSAFEQGIMQNARQSALGVDTVTGRSMSQNAGVITEAAVIKKILANTSAETGGHFKRIYNENGTVVALERSLDPHMMQRVETDGELSKMIGIWRGRQAEEANAQIFNESLVDALKAMYTKDVKANRGDEYIDLFSTKDPVLQDSMRLMNRETRDYITDSFPDGFMVRQDLLDDAIGYRSATVGDAWTGNSRWSKKTQETVKNLAMTAFGNEAYQKFTNAEKILQNVVSDAKVLIVVKSVVVPIANIISNMYQLAARGVPLAAMSKAMPVKTAELTSYIKGQYRLKELEAELRASTGNRNATLKLEAEKLSLEDGFSRMSIWPLIQAGEFSSVSDASIGREEIMLSEGRLNGYIEGLVSKLPPALATVGKYGLVTKDTALFKGLQKTVEYGDFLAKSIYYDDLTKRKGMTQKDALGLVTEEFVNYDRLSGRFRGYLESVGLLWFYNFKIRSIKVAASMIRNNPLHSLIAGLAPAPSVFGSVGLPFTDSLINKAVDGTIDYSVGWGQGLGAFGLNPWVNLAH